MLYAHSGVHSALIVAICMHKRKTRDLPQWIFHVGYTPVTIYDVRLIKIVFILNMPIF